MTMRPSDPATLPQATTVATDSAYGLNPDQTPVPLQGSTSTKYASPFEQPDGSMQQWTNQHQANWEDPLVIQSNRRAGNSPSSGKKAESLKSADSEHDELTGLSRSKAAVMGESARPDSDPLTGTRSRAAGLPYPGRLLRYIPGQPLQFDRAALQWQTRMRERGWAIQADGFYGADSARICRQFQRAKGLSADGVVGPATWTATFRNDVVIRPQPGGTSRINQRGLDLIKSFEGLSLRAYRDPVGIWTIGYGHTGPEVGPGDVITRAQAETLLRNDLTRFENGVRSLVKVPLSANQFSALVSFAFNVGTGALGQSTLLARLNQRDYQGAANEFSRWVYGDGQVLPGLVRRREAEKQLFLA